MRKLDHFVVHIDDNEAILTKLKEEIEPLGFPFEPKWGKGTKGFKAANIWIGRQYFEIIRLLRPDGGGWVPNWVIRYNRGTRGLYCVFLMTDEIEQLAVDLKNRGLDVSEPERISFSACFGLIRKTLPWRLIYLPPVPGTEFELGFIQYDPDPKDRIKKYLVPNSDEVGIDGIHSAAISLPLNHQAVDFLRKVFPDGTNAHENFEVQLDNGKLNFENASVVETQFFAETSDSKLKGNDFRLLDVRVQT